MIKHWVLSLVFMFIAILCGFECYKAIAIPDKNWLKIGFFGVICIASSIFYFKERAKRMALFRERMKNK